MRIFHSNVIKTIAVTLLLTFFIEIISPVVLFAQTGGNSQSEASGGGSVTQTQMVDPFTGQFSYNLPLLNVPGPNGSGYPIALSYNSNVNPMDDASWVGYGWNLNLGAINRAKRGIADDINGEKVQIYNKMDDIKSWSASQRVGLEIRDESFSGGLNGSMAISYNNYIGWGLGYQVGANVFGIVSAGANYDRIYDNSYTVGISIPAIIGKILAYNRKQKDPKWEQGEQGPPEPPSTFEKALKWMKNIGNVGYTFRQDAPYSSNDLTIGDGTNVTYMFGLQLGAGFVVGPSIGNTGTYTSQPVFNKKYSEEKHYGSMYSENALSDNYAKMDYYLEKDKGIRTKKQPFLAIPFSAADIFSVNSEGQRGAFRLFRTKTGSFRPAKREASLDCYTVGIEGILGAEFGASASLRYASKRISLGEWSHEGSRNQWYTYNEYYPSSNIDLPWRRLTREPFKFLFLNDMASSVQFSYDDAPLAYDISWGVDDIRMYRYMNRGKVTSGTTAISCNTVLHSLANAKSGAKRSVMAWDRVGFYGSNAENINGAGSYDEFKPPKSFKSQTPSGSGTFDYSRFSSWQKKSVLASSIGEFALTNPNGSIYVYGLPVYSRNELTLSIPTYLNRNNSEEKNLFFEKEQHSYLSRLDDAPNLSKPRGTVNVNQVESLKKVVGEKHEQPYATSFLLTEILSPDYVDKTGDGPTSDDLGGYTIFHYKKRYAGQGLPTTSTGWYKWRSPYRGLYNSEGKLSTPKDDMAYFTSGEKEIYYLESIETKTHIAYFVSNRTDILSEGIQVQGSLTYRKDGFPADLPGLNDNSFLTRKDDEVPSNAYNANKLEVLEEIRLYSKEYPIHSSTDVKYTLVKKVKFAYDYSLMQGQPNSLKPSGASKSLGKLTLRQIWFESEGIHNIRISPYTFEYKYPNNAAPYSTKYSSLFAGFVTGTKNENPDFQYGSTDRWGVYQEDGAQRYVDYNPWVDQTPQNTFDPASWHLKSIALPSGGKIFIQYEQKDYQYVQDKVAEVMANLSEESHDDGLKTDAFEDESFKDIIQDGANIFDPNVKNSYKIDITSILGIYNQADADKIVSQIKKLYIDTKDKVFFKFLYKFGSGSEGIRYPDESNYEYISGYTTIKTCSVSLASGTTHYNLEIKLGEDGKVRDKPLYGAIGFLRSYNIASRAQSHEEARDLFRNPDKNINSSGDLNPEEEDSPLTFIGNIFSYLTSRASITHVSEYATPQLKPRYSYIRIPIVKPKKGGGVRVKRVLMLNPENSLETGDEAIYGTEYRYEDGVATTEPNAGREENTLIRPIKGADGYLINSPEIIAGDDLPYFEGPLGETLLPSPSIGYSKVTVSDINTQSPTGYTIYNYNTCKDYPSVTVSQTNLNKFDDGTNVLNVALELFTGVKLQTIKMSQGFSFTTTNMHGTLKEVWNCSGAVSPTGDPSVFASTKYDYFPPGEEVPVMYALEKPFRMRSLGKQMDLAMESRFLDDDYDDLTLEFSLTWQPITFFNFSIAPNFVYQSTNMFTHGTSKVITYPPIVKRITV